MKVYNFQAPTPQGSAARDHQIFLQAIDFHEGAIRAGVDMCDVNGRSTASMNAAVVCYAFAAELYLKCLCLIGSALPLPKAHRLHLIFGRLDADVRGHLASCYESLTGRAEAALRHDLGQFTDAFRDWRYVYEGEGQQVHTNLLQAFAKAAYVTVRELRPTWEVSDADDDRLRNYVSPSMTLFNLGGGTFLHAVDGTGLLNTKDG